MGAEIWRGRPYPLGASWDGEGVNFALFSEHADKVELCLFDSVGSTRETKRIVLPEYTDHVWHGYLPGVNPGQLYGYRVYGPYQPELGSRFNHYKLLLDPYARLIARGAKWDASLFGYDSRSAAADLSFSTRDSAPFAPLAAVADETFDWGADRRPAVPWERTVIYEAHVKGMTMLHPEVNQEWRGTMRGLTHDAVIRHLQDLGVTSIELLPMHGHVDEEHLVRADRVNYWGYNTLSFFAPEPRYSSPRDALGAMREFKSMVKILHAAGIEVILDVVYNHTAEGNQLGPTLSFRGIDNASYYRLSETHPRYYEDFTGCGNTLDFQHPRVLQLTMDSLRYWIEEGHVDGFRFDLASTLAREVHDVDKLSAFFDIIHQDPTISRVKLIAEPWDAASGGYQVGNFPVLWTEWNDQYRDTMRSFWGGEKNVLGSVATRLAGSSDLFRLGGRSPQASINFITCHDGFTLQDLVSYNAKHNERNGEENRDGSNHNISWNCGMEGKTTDAAILDLRERQKRNYIFSLMVSLGVPMLLGSDELSRSQDGNNNTYCQDNELNHYSWKLGKREAAFLQFVKNAIAVRQSEVALQRRKFFTGQVGPDGRTDVTWLKPDGGELRQQDWERPAAAVLGVCFSGSAVADRDIRGEERPVNTLYAAFNATLQPASFVLPGDRRTEKWQLLLTTAEETGLPSETAALRAGERVTVADKSAVLMRLIAKGPTDRQR